jgi:glycosyltransferase involved in cell wall biosynthesis
MMALKDEMERQGVRVVVNKLSQSVDVHICNSCWFDFKKLERKAGDFPVRMIHRIDGPVTLYRGEGNSVDEEIFSLNRRLATATVFQSAYCFKKSYELGFRAVSPTIIHNGVNGDIFNERNPLAFDQDRKIKLITTAWSDNPRKGGAFLKWLDNHLDWDRFDYSFVGRVKESFTNISHIQAVPSEELAELLRGHDIYVSVSQHEPCSNALLEALNCGLPALYRNDGGNPELVSFGGLPFHDESDVLGQLDRLVARLESYRSMIYVRDMEDITRRYINLAHRICSWTN